jgi:methanogenic corrinoid protein MtbC1
MWERRYAFPKPKRNANGNRVYCADDVGRLVLIARAMKAGYRPGEVVGKKRVELEQVLARSNQQPAALAADNDNLEPVLDAIARDDLAEAHRTLHSLSASHGARAFVTEVAGPLLVQTGLAWAGGRIQVRHEHMLSEILTSQLRALLAPFQAQVGSPVVLLCTLPHELHRLGLDMAAVFLAVIGVDVRVLGPNSPADQIVATAKAQDVDAVAVSVSLNTDPPAARGYLSWIESELTGATELWVGGAGALSLSVEAPVILLPSWETTENNVRRLRGSRI